jgi:hypothetical protein
VAGQDVVRVDARPGPFDLALSHASILAADASLTPVPHRAAHDERAGRVAGIVVEGLGRIEADLEQAWGPDEPHLGLPFATNEQENHF